MYSDGNNGTSQKVGERWTLNQHFKGKTHNSFHDRYIQILTLTIPFEHMQTNATNNVKTYLLHNRFRSQLFTRSQVKRRWYQTSCMKGQWLRSKCIHTSRWEHSKEKGDLWNLHCVIINSLLVVLWCCDVKRIKRFCKSSPELWVVVLLLVCFFLCAYVYEYTLGLFCFVLFCFLARCA